MSVRSRTIGVALATFVLLTGAVAALVIRKGSWNSDDALVFTGARRILAPLRPDTNEMSFGGLVVTNSSDSTVSLVAARALALDDAVEVTGWAVLRPSENENSSFLTSCGPMPHEGWKLHALQGFEIRPGETLHVILGLRRHARGAFGVRTVGIDYRDQAGNVMFRRVDHSVGFRVKDSTPCRSLPPGPLAQD